jgi:hypothetical protein
MSDALDRILNMRGVSFLWREVVNGIPQETTNIPNVGFIAQEVEEYFPQAISESVDGTKLVNYPILIAVVTEALQQQNTILLSKEIEITQLEKTAKEKGLL